MQPERHALRSPLQCKARGSRLPMRCVVVALCAGNAERGCKSLCLCHAGWEQTYKVVSLSLLLVACTQIPPGPFCCVTRPQTLLAFLGFGADRVR